MKKIIFKNLICVFYIINIQAEMNKNTIQDSFWQKYISAPYYKYIVDPFTRYLDWEIKNVDPIMDKFLIMKRLKNWLLSRGWNEKQTAKLVGTAQVLLSLGGTALLYTYLPKLINENYLTEGVSMIKTNDLQELLRNTRNLEHLRKSKRNNQENEISNYLDSTKEIPNFEHKPLERLLFYRTSKIKK